MMMYFKHLWIVGLLCLTLIFFGLFPTPIVATLGLIAFGLWVIYLVKYRLKLAKSLLVFVVASIGLYQFFAYYGMKDSTLQNKTLFAKACGDFSHEHMDFWVCEKNCKFHDGKIEMYSDNNGQLSREPFLTGEIIERKWCYGQPVLYIRFGNDTQVSRYCLK